jgi:ribosome-binding factor A
MSTAKRQKRVAERIQEEISDALLRFADPRLQGVTITDVEASPDLRVAKVWYSVLGDDEEIKTATEALQKAAGSLRRELAVRINMRYTPELMFRLDASWKRGARVDQLLERIAVESPQDDPASEG